VTKRARKATPAKLPKRGGSIVKTKKPKPYKTPRRKGG
jgi:hypothetical protein